MISINLNAMEEWERVRRDTEPHTPDVDRNPGTENPDRPELDDGSHGLKVTPEKKRRRRGGEEDAGDEAGESADAGDEEEDEAFEVDIGEGEAEIAPPEGPRAPVEPYRGQNVDLEA